MFPPTSKGTPSPGTWLGVQTLAVRGGLASGLKDYQMAQSQLCGFVAGISPSTIGMSDDFNLNVLGGRTEHKECTVVVQLELTHKDMGVST